VYPRWHTEWSNVCVNRVRALHTLLDLCAGSSIAVLMCACHRSVGEGPGRLAAVYGWGYVLGQTEMAELLAQGPSGRVDATWESPYFSAAGTALVSRPIL